MEECIFCRIAQKKIPCKMIYETDNAMAFLDINPGSSGHTLVIPKKHYDTIDIMPEDEVIDLFKVAIKVMKAVDKVIKPDGINLFQNNKLAAGQIVNHTHIHIFPRFRGDKIDFRWGRVPLDNEDMDRIAELIRGGLE